MKMALLLPPFILSRRTISYAFSLNKKKFNFFPPLAPKGDLSHLIEAHSEALPFFFVGERAPSTVWDMVIKPSLFPFLFARVGRVDAFLFFIRLGEDSTFPFFLGRIAGLRFFLRISCVVERD